LLIDSVDLFMSTVYTLKSLMESYCYPVLSYAVECFNLPNSCIRQLNACWNSVYRRSFDFKPWESVRELISCLERMNLEYLYYQKKLYFWIVWCVLLTLLLCQW